MTFDASAFMTQTVTAPMSTRITPCPEGEFMARVGDGENDVTVESIQGKKDPSKTYIRLTLQWEILDESVKQKLERDSVRVRDQFLLDIDPATGMLETGEGKNVALGQRREALGMNDGEFNIAMFRGAGPAMVRVKHRPNENDPSNPYAEIGRVVKL